MAETPVPTSGPLLSTLARSIVDKVAKEAPGSTVVPATIVAPPTQSAAQEHATVHFAGDPQDVSYQVSVLCTESLYQGDTVMVLMVPPAGAFLIGRATANIQDAVRLTRTGAPSPASFGGTGQAYDVAFPTTSFKEGRIEVSDDSRQISVPRPGLYIIGAQFTWRTFVSPITSISGEVLSNISVYNPQDNTSKLIGSSRKTYSGTSTTYISDHIGYTYPYYLSNDEYVRFQIAHNLAINGGLPAASIIRSFDEENQCTFSVVSLGGRYVEPA